MSAKNYSFTINNPTEQDETCLQNAEVQFIIYQLELGENLTEHFQGYVQFTSRKTKRSANILLGNRAHLEVSRGSPEDNITYCSKVPQIRGPYQRGEVSRPGTRTDIVQFIESIKRSSTDAELLETNPELFLRHARVIDRVRSAYITKRQHEMQVTVYWGPSGTGKTRRATQEAGDSTYWVSKGDKSQTIWWDGYVGQESVILDDFYGWLPWTFMLRLLDRYPFQIQYKGGMREFTSKNIFITSNQEPASWYTNIPNNDMTPLLRRINKIEHIVF